MTPAHTWPFPCLASAIQPSRTLNGLWMGFLPSKHEAGKQSPANAGQGEELGVSPYVVAIQSGTSETLLTMEKFTCILLGQRSPIQHSFPLPLTAFCTHVYESWFSWCYHFGLSTSLTECSFLVFLTSSSFYFHFWSWSSSLPSLSILATHRNLLASTTPSWWIRVIVCVQNSLLTSKFSAVYWLYDSFCPVSSDKMRIIIVPTS